MKYITLADIEAVGSEYWRPVRWQYIKVAIEFAKQFDVQSVLEAGPAGLPIAKMSDTLDIKTHLGHTPTYAHDMTVVPWPIQRQYDMFVALQVWEHLQGAQQQAFKEALRIAKKCIILSFPFKWLRAEESHSNIDDDTIREWTLGYPISNSRLIETPDNKRDRKVVCFRVAN